ncbi:MAG: hypothetical protein EXX96DRAFT_378633 [Benjaminiella poitrasii]|nr:MAG: hypothetical protein EXX96DRAFT_378633 [Benjaminiella poitrasii]
MSNNSNPKLYYNQADYSGSSVIHKPDEITAADTLPPPPYYPPENASSSVSSGYNSIRNSAEQQQQQAGLLSNSSNWKQNTNPHTYEQQQSRLPRHQHTSDPLMATTDNHYPIPSRSETHRSCCRKWSKYLFIAFLIWLVAFKYSSSLPSSWIPTAPHTNICRTDAVSWKAVPSVLGFDKDLDLVIDGRITGGQITITTTDTNDGLVLPDITIYPHHLADQMTYTTEGHTRIFLQMPPQTLKDNIIHAEEEECISVHLEIRVPSKTERLSIDAHNLDIVFNNNDAMHLRDVQLKTTNGRVTIQTWTGDRLQVSTTQGEVRTGRLVADDTVVLDNSNGAIIVSGPIEAKRKVQVTNVNGPVTLDEVRARDRILVESSNQVVHVGRLVADEVTLRNANEAFVVTESVEAKRQVVAHTSNAPISISVLSDKDSKVNVLTSNAEIDLHVTNRFEGRFVMSTSHGEVMIDDEHEIEYEYNVGYLKQGVRKGMGKKGDLTVQTSNANVQVSFDLF